ncbi:hypothetical protein CKAH01_02417 [Colletotrichum kahawae]|uniref:Uncharacterized protein n=1 Tax=Colletotrichum kahawae TaxID=34407 RepID=A0AAE0CZ15_COLKA|nr:hypothetical protein CKAH01_02417 [Colletotrichum kahawae]
MYHFEYPISRPYPFKWFTPVAITGGIILTVVFSLVNLKSNGFDLKPAYTTDVNGTEAAANARWFNKPPFNWQGDMDVECQPYLLTVGDSFFTSNHGFRYKVKSIELPTRDDESPDIRSSIGYKNTTLEGCFMSQMFIKLMKSDPARLPSWWISFKNTVAAATLQCTVVSDVGLAEVTMEAEYEGETEPVYDYVMDSNYKTRASVWWGTRLSNAYFIGILSAASQIPGVDVLGETYLNRARLTFNRNSSKTDIRSEDFFNLGWTFQFDNSYLQTLWMDLPYDTTPYNSDFWGSPTLTEALHYSKIMHSLFALDLGNCESPNLLLDEDGLRYAIIDPQDTNRFPGALLNNFTEAVQLDNGRFTKLPKPSQAGSEASVPLNESYSVIQPLMGPLSCNKATIAAQYLCSVPRQKSVGVMLLAIILADLVFLQAAWKLLQWIAGSRMANIRQTNVCEGCLLLQGQSRDGIELVDKPRGRKQEGSARGPNDRYVRLHSQE